MNPWLMGYLRKSDGFLVLVNIMGGPLIKRPSSVASRRVYVRKPGQKTTRKATTGTQSAQWCNLWFLSVELDCRQVASHPVPRGNHSHLLEYDFSELLWLIMVHVYLPIIQLIFDMPCHILPRSAATLATSRDAEIHQPWYTAIGCRNTHRTSAWRNHFRILLVNSLNMSTQFCDWNWIM